MRSFVGTVCDAPHHLVDNEYIRHGYRIGYDNSMVAIFKSLFHLHNEFVNVWSHFCGMLLFVGLIIYTLFFLNSMRVGSHLIKSDFINNNEHALPVYF